MKYYKTPFIPHEKIHFIKNNNTSELAILKNLFWSRWNLSKSFFSSEFHRVYLLVYFCNWETIGYCDQKVTKKSCSTSRQPFQVSIFFSLSYMLPISKKHPKMQHKRIQKKAQSVGLLPSQHIFWRLSHRSILWKKTSYFACILQKKKKMLYQKNNLGHSEPPNTVFFNCLNAILPWQYFSLYVVSFWPLGYLLLQHHHLHVLQHYHLQIILHQLS